MEQDSPVNMMDLLYQAEIDDDIELPTDEWDLEFYDQDLTDEDLKELMNESN